MSKQGKLYDSSAYFSGLQSVKYKESTTLISIRKFLSLNAPLSCSMGIPSLLRGCYSSIVSTFTEREKVFPSTISHKDSGNRINGCTAFAEKRLWKECRDTESDFFRMHCICRPVGNDLFKWEAAILGPSGTPYEGGIFLLAIKLSEDYPFKPPHIRFLTKVYHPDIGKDGTFNLGMQSECDWSTAMTIEKTILLICSYLPDPLPEDPKNPVSVMYWNDRKSYDEVARKWTKKYATASSTKACARACMRLKIPVDDAKQLCFSFI